MVLIALWSRNLKDTDAALDWLYQDCIKAGPGLCPVYEETVPLIRHRVDGLLRKLKVRPATFYDVPTKTYGEVDYSIAKYAIFSSLYSLHTSGRRLAIALAELERGDAKPLFDMARRKLDHTSFTCNCPPKPLPPSGQGAYINLAIACSDGAPVRYSLEELQEFYAEMGEESVFAEVMTRRIGCS